MLHSTVTVRRVSDPGRWVRLTMNLRPTPEGSPFVEYPPGFRCRIAPADGEAARYSDDTWLSGVVSGLGFAWRRWLRPDRGVAVSEVCGHLGHGDVEGVALAAAAAARELLGQSSLAAGNEWAVDDVSAPPMGSSASVPTPVPTA